MPAIPTAGSPASFIGVDAPHLGHPRRIAMEISNTIDPVLFPTLHGLAEQGKGLLNEVIGDWAGSPDLKVQWYMPDCPPKFPPTPPTVRPIHLRILDPPEHIEASFLPREFDDSDRVRYKLLRTWAIYLKHRSHEQLERLDQLVKNLDGD